MRPLRLVLFVPLLAALAACDSGVPEVSSFQATLTGELDRQLEGPAGIQCDEGPESLTFCIEMVPGGFGVEGLRLTSEGLGITGRGSYPLGITRGGWIGLEYAGPDGRYAADVGSVEIRRFSDDLISGSFSATLRSTTGEGTLHVQGDFDALPPDPTILY